MARISPQPMSDWSPEMKSFVENFRSSVTRDTPNRRREGRPAAANMLGTLARYPALAKAFLSFNNHILDGSTLSDRQAELLILRVAALRHCKYEWAQHVVRGEDAGLTAEEISRIAVGPDAPDWSPVDRSMLQAVDELIDEAMVSTDTWKALSEHLGEHQLMDLIFTVGTYELVAMAFRSFDVELDADLTPFLPRNW